MAGGWFVHRKKREKEKKPEYETRVPIPGKEEDPVENHIIDLIAEAFDRHAIKYRIVNVGEISFIEAGFNIEGGPVAQARFFAQNKDSNDVQIRICGLMQKIAEEKETAILKACNRLNSEMRFFKFYLDRERDLIGEGDLPARISEESVGECCFELFVRAMQILNRCYHYFPEAYYGAGSEEKKESLLNALNALKDLRDHPVTIPPDQKEGQ